MTDPEIDGLLSQFREVIVEFRDSPASQGVDAQQALHDFIRQSTKDFSMRSKAYLDLNDCPNGLIKCTDGSCMPPGSC
jgi:hypothetical protein